MDWHAIQKSYRIYLSVRTICSTCKVMPSIRIGRRDLAQNGIDEILNIGCPYSTHTLENWICNQRCVEFPFLEGEKMKEIKDKVMEDCRLTKKNDNGLKTNSVPTPSTSYICLFSVHYEFLVVSVLISLCPFHRLYHVLLRFPSNFLEL